MDHSFLAAPDAPEAPLPGKITDRMLMQSTLLPALLSPDVLLTPRGLGVRHCSHLPAVGAAQVATWAFLSARGGGQRGKRQGMVPHTVRHPAAVRHQVNLHPESGDLT
jgi:hypothetical protein